MRPWREAVCLFSDPRSSCPGGHSSLTVPIGSCSRACVVLPGSDCSGHLSSPLPCQLQGRGVSVDTRCRSGRCERHTRHSTRLRHLGPLAWTLPGEGAEDLQLQCPQALSCGLTRALEEASWPGPWRRCPALPGTHSKGWRQQPRKPTFPGPACPASFPPAWICIWRKFLCGKGWCQERDAGHGRGGQHVMAVTERPVIIGMC